MSTLKHLISLKDIKTPEIHNLLDKAQSFINTPPSQDTFKGQTQINLFFENSTRTRTSFEIAGKKLGMHVVNMNIATSSVKKGETLRDTILTINAMQPNVIVIRHNLSGAAKFITDHVDCPVVNAGDGLHAHPTQALLDALTIRQSKNKIAGLNIGICGDILHSRVARSDIICLSKLGANIRLIAPYTLLPKHLHIESYTNMKEGLKDLDAIIMLRLQKERMGGAFIPSMREYAHFYGLNKEKLKYLKEDCIILHPGPINRNIEISPEVAECDRSLILNQVSNGVYVRMAVIHTLLEKQI